MTTANPARGEVAVTIGGVDLIISCSMASLSAFEALVNRRFPKEGAPHGMGDILNFAAAIPFSMITEALECFIKSGDAKAALAGFEVEDTIKAQQAINAAIMSKYMSKAGNAGAAGEAT